MPQAYLSACTIYRDAGSYLAEWIEFHLLAGVERFFLYDNGSSDHHREVLAPYLEEGIAVLHDWPLPFIGARGRGGAIVRSLDHCLRTHGHESRWIAFLDIDEFLFSPTGAPVSQLLPEYEEYPGLCVSRAEFGTSGHRTRPEGLVIENYVHRRRVGPDDRARVKSIVDPGRTMLPLGPHTFLYRDGLAVDENRRPVDFDFRALKPVSWSRFRIHHYWSKSQEDFASKTTLWRDLGTQRGTYVELPQAPQGQLDETLAAYGPAVREALERRARGHSPTASPPPPVARS
jgi:hypothetical protein